MSKKPKVEIDTTAQAAAMQAQTAAVQEQTRAQQAQADAAAKAEQARQVAAENASTLARNVGSDLKGENIAQVVAGGSADVAAGTPQSTLKKKRMGGPLSSQLGVNV